MALARAWGKSACSVSAVTVRQTSPSRMRPESPLPCRNQTDCSLQGPVTWKNARSASDTTTPAKISPETTGSAGGSSGRRFSRM